jgi:SAM-dependent methyltransferase
MAHFTLSERLCPICKNSAQARLFAEANFAPDELDQFAFASRKIPEYMHWKLWQCGTCDLLFANPVPKSEELGGLYREAAFASSDEARRASRTYGKLLKNMLGNLPAKSGALDIGTGDGAFLGELLDCGFTDVVGIEPSTAPIESADARVKSLIRQGLFQEGTFEAGRFSVVTCFQTIEHVPEPLNLAKEALRILKPGGAFLLVGHNRRSFSAKVLGKRSPIFDIEHLQLFSPASFAALLKAAGFTRVEVAPIWNVYPLGYWSQLFPIPRGVKTGFLKLLQMSRAGRIPIALPAGNLVAMGYR